MLGFLRSHYPYFYHVYIKSHLAFVLQGDDRNEVL